jgi:hypothetical protein
MDKANKQESIKMAVRYFICSAILKINVSPTSLSFGFKSESFPSKQLLKAKVEKDSGGRDIQIMAISEVSEADYNTFFG